MSSSTSSPYAELRGLPTDSFTSTFMYSNVSPGLKSNVSKITAEMCQGHFEGNPALLPIIAFLASSFCSYLCGEAISQITGMNIPFHIDSTCPETKNNKRRRNGSSEER